VGMLCVRTLVRGEHRRHRREDPMAGQVDLFGRLVPKIKERKRRPPKKKGGGGNPESGKPDSEVSVNQTFKSG